MKYDFKLVKIQKKMRDVWVSCCVGANTELPIKIPMPIATTAATSTIPPTVVCGRWPGGAAGLASSFKFAAFTSRARRFEISEIWSAKRISALTNILSSRARATSNARFSTEMLR